MVLTWQTVNRWATTAPPKDHETIRNILRLKQQSGLAPTTGEGWRNVLLNLSHHTHNPITSLTKQEIDAWLDHSQQYTPATRNKYCSNIRWILKHLNQPDLAELVPATIRNKNRETIPIEKLPTKTEIPHLLRACTGQRNRAIIALLFDTGVRAGELLNMEIGDIDLDAPVPTIRIRQGKTGQRLIPIIPYYDGHAPFSPGELELWLNAHPTGKGHLWTSAKNPGNPLSHTGLQWMLDSVTTRTNREHHLHPHLFRHACATERASQLTDAEMEAFFGWTPGSSMRARYARAAGVRAGLLQRAQQIAGITENQQPQQPKRCSICTAYTPTDARFCPRCGAPTTPGEAGWLIQRLITDLQKNPEETGKKLAQLLNQ